MTHQVTCTGVFFVNTEVQAGDRRSTGNLKTMLRHEFKDDGNCSLVLTLDKLSYMPGVTYQVTIQ